MTLSLYLIWVACIAIAPLYNILGEKMILIGLLLPIILRRKMRVEKGVAAYVISFMLFFGIKLIFAINGYNAVSSFHSIYTLAFGMLELAILFMFIGSCNFSSIIDNDINKRRIRAFIIISFYGSLLASIILMLIRGRDFYRLNLASGGIFAAPQFFLLIAIVMAMALTYEAIKNRNRRILNIVLIVIGFIYILLANYTTQLIFYIFAVLLVTALTAMDTTVKKVFGVIVLAAFTVFAVNRLPDFIYWVNNRFFSQNYTMHMRLNEIYTLLRFGDAGRDLNGRFDLMSTSFGTFKEHWLLGVPFSKYNTVNTGIIVGDHSEWVDDLARYGAIGSLLFAIFSIKGIKTIFMEFRLNKTMIISNTILIGLYGFANPIIKIFLMCGLVLASSILACSEETIIE